tara:strand:- start:12942 stop:13766 length:825 start_codon:yes stop_codon:yes gene_type:complete
MAGDFKLETLNICNTQIEMLTGGSGDPLLILHGTDGSLGWLEYAEQLSQNHTVYIPSHPGFGNSEKPSWIQTISDLSCFYSWFIEELQLENCNLIGFSIGGWIAAELLSVSPSLFNKVVLVDSAGIKPQQSDIVDIFLLTPQQVAQLMVKNSSQVPEFEKVFENADAPSGTYYITGSTGSFNPQYVADKNRETAVRLCWKPYMFDPKLPYTLNRVKNPVQIIWGKNDAVIPPECATLFQHAIPNSQLNLIDNCGHLPHMEQTDEFVKLVNNFLV